MYITDNREKALSFVTIWMNLEGIIPSKFQAENVKYHYFTLSFGKETTLIKILSKSKYNYIKIVVTRVEWEKKTSRERDQLHGE